MPRQTKATKDVSQWEAGKVVFNFETLGETFTMDVTAYPPEIQKRLMVHGASQKGGDSYSGEQDPAAALAELKRVDTALRNGTWAERSAAGAGLSDFVAALQRLTSQPEEKVREFIESISEEQIAALKKDENVKAVVAAIKAERAASRVGGAPSLDLNAALAAATPAPSEPSDAEAASQ